MKKNLSQQMAEVYNKLGAKYLKDSAKLIPVERGDFAKNFPKGAYILDVGCGGGRDSKFFTKKGLEVIGTDISDVLIAEARKQVPKAQFICQDILKLNFPKDSFDGIWANAILLHLRRKSIPGILKRFFKILKPGGIVHIRVKKGTGEGFVKEKLSGWSERFYTYFSKSEIQTLLKNAGFKIIHAEILPDESGRPNVTWIAVWARK